MTDKATADVLGLTAKIVSAHLSKTQVGVDALPALIQAVYLLLANAGQAVEAPPPIQTPAVPWKKSVFPDYIICLEDGAKLKMMKRVLSGLAPRRLFDCGPSEYGADPQWRGGQECGVSNAGRNR